ncbi:hypothetical protein [Fluviispira sanaruensis]|uniref:Lipoprotein n=1 Tax=Fluviispira sanaruensis TaxID=2493639 RepID=A0A4P2VNQ7_FLUSA|nr:hypothetical protein [Fluviispira sanaruensis]BBH53279.1 hypothetical protein JCM31447_17220 [Fluviispira sanaruensis]
MFSYFKIFIVFVCTAFVASCGKLKQQNLGFELRSPALPKFQNNGLTYTSFAPIHIPISITSSTGFSYTGALQAGANTISLPVATALTIQIGYLAYGLTAGQTLAQQCSQSNNSPNAVLYTEYTTSFSIDETSSSVNINFPNPFTEVNFDHFGFKIKTSSGTPAANAVAYFEDVISQSAIVDPCKNAPLYNNVDSGGRLPINIPIYSSTSQFRIRIVAADGTTQVFSPTLPRGASNAQFYFMQFGSGAVTAMNESTDSFLDDGYPIAVRRDSMNRNPRYADINTYTFNPPDISTGLTNFHPANQTSGSNRSLVVKCQITIDSSGSHGAVIVPYQTCPLNISNIYTYFTQLSTGTYYFLDAYLMDSENFLASNTSATNPYTPILNSSPFPHSFLTPGSPP